MSKIYLSMLIFFCISVSTHAFSPPPPGPAPAQEEIVEEEKTVAANTPVDPAATVPGITSILSGLNGGGGMPINNAGDFGLENMTLSGGASFTSFDDSTSNSSGHFREYYLSLSGDITESDSITIGLSQTRFETGAQNSVLARTNGISFTYIHHLSENYGVGAFALLNDVDIEETNGNSYSYAYGFLFTTFHDFEDFNLSTATALAHADFDTGYDQLLMTAWTLSKPWTDDFSTYLTLSFIDSFKSDPDGDPTYGTWEIGGNYNINDNLTVGLGFQRTEFLNNFTDNTLLINLGYRF